MDKYEYNLKLEEITKLADQGYYEDAADIIDTIDWRRVRNVRTLCMISEIYEEVGRLQDSKALLLRAYRKSQAVRSILFHLTEISVKLREFDDAAEFYSEFVEAAPHDNSRYLLKYMIYRGRGAAIEDQIEILEEYNQKEYTEKYAYELAKLYYRAGQKEKCVDACDDLVVWFRQGKYVIRALELKQRIKALTPVQQAIYDNRNEATMPKAEMVENVAPDLEKAILENMPESSKEVITDDVISVTEKEIAQSVAEHTAEKEENDDYGIFAAFSENQEKTDQEEQDFHKELPVTRMPQRRQRMMQRSMRKLWMTQIPKRKTYQKKRQMQPVRMHRQKRIKNMNLIQKTFRQNLQRVCGIFSPVFRENRMRVTLSNR